MKRNKLLRASAALLILTLITSCFVGGTFAKYVSEGEGTANARVAKWGVTAEWTGDLFYSVYKNNGKDTVVGQGSFVVAPGTESQEALELTLSGKPEVSGTFETTVDELTFDGWYVKPNGTPLTEDEISNQDYVAETEFYCPLQFVINGATGSPIDGCDYTSPDDLKTAIKDAIEKNPLANGEFDAGDTLNQTFKLEWYWPFEGGSGSEQTDAKDTYLGNKAASDRAPTITIKITTTVEQVD